MGQDRFPRRGDRPRVEESNDSPTYRRGKLRRGIRVLIDRRYSDVSHSMITRVGTTDGVVHGGRMMIVLDDSSLILAFIE